MSHNSGSRDQSNEAHQSDELASRLAYECGWQLCEHAIRTLEAQRTRAMALLSVTLVAAGIVTSALLAGAGDIAGQLGWVGGLGGGLLAVSALAVTVSTAVVAWPVKMDVLEPKTLIKNFIESQQAGRTSVWVHKSLASDLAEAHARFNTTLEFRNMFYKWSVGCASAVVAGAVMVAFDAIV